MNLPTSEEALAWYSAEVGLILERMRGVSSEEGLERPSMTTRKDFVGDKMEASRSEDVPEDACGCSCT